MDELQYHLLARVEQEHWWFRALHRWVRRALDSRGGSGLRVLDAPCGTGGLLASLLESHQSYGVDRSQLAISYCRTRALPVLQANLEELPFAEASFDVLTSIDGLQHVRDHRRALSEIRRVLVPGGQLILSTAAFSWLYGEHDRAVHTVRRFTRGELVRVVEESGFRVVSARYRLAFLPPFMLAQNLLRRRLRPAPAHADIELPSPWLNGVLGMAGRLDQRFGGRAPFGSTIALIAERPRR